MLQLPAEAVLLSEEEEELCDRMLEDGGLPLAACDMPVAA